MVEIRTVLETAEMRLLLRGQVQLSVHSKRNPEQRLKGTVGPRISCDLFDSLVTAAEALTPVVEEPQQQGPSNSAALAMAWMYMSASGTIQYRIKLRGIQSSVTRVTIETAPAVKPSHKKPRVVEDVTGHLQVESGWINGTVPRLSARDLELLHEGELYVNVATEDWPVSEIRGRLIPRLAGESHLAMESGPVLLNPVGSSAGNVTVSRAALGWVHVDKECNFHYDVAVTSPTGSSSSHSSSRANRDSGSLTVLELVDIPRLSIGSASEPGIMLMDSSGPAGGEVASSFLPNIRLLEEFSGLQVENSVGDLNKLSLARMDAGVAYLKLTESPAIGSGSSGAQFQGWLTNVHVPGSCLPFGFKSGLMEEGGGDSGGAAGQQQSSAGYVFDRHQDDNNEIPLSSATRCFYEGKLYEDGAAWTAEHDRCMMCSCQRGRVVCDPVVCPALTCGASASVVQRPGDCCPMCESKSSRIKWNLKAWADPDGYFVFVFLRCDGQAGRGGPAAGMQL